MSLIMNGLQLAGSVFRTNLTRVVSVKLFRSSAVQLQEDNAGEAITDDGAKTDTAPARNINPAKDRTKVIPLETSQRYLKSNAYKETYGDFPVWKLYRRNHKGQFAPRKTRKTCIRKDVISTGNPCPICRDEYLVIDYRNVDLLKQFISEYNGDIIKYTKTGVCMRQHTQLLIAIQKARDHGFIKLEVPLKYYDYSEWQSVEPAAQI